MSECGAGLATSVYERSPYRRRNCWMDSDEDVYVGISESGRSAETVAALRQVRRAARRGHELRRLRARGGRRRAAEAGRTVPSTRRGTRQRSRPWGFSASTGAARPVTGPPCGLAERVIAEAKPVVESVAERFDRARIIDVVGWGSSNTAGEGRFSCGRRPGLTPRRTRRTTTCTARWSRSTTAAPASS